ncbi:SIS domain-containing protein [Streptomyces sp. BE230]|uniref:SIS domain-containing protein n=1 Tax=Streptomyces sp. BE230 TaxID=3002526 RepID=UPI002ED4CFCC|nr:SIS domain-containing protein [Streptomyces sp. BE230]
MTLTVYEDFTRAYLTEVNAAVRRMLTRNAEAAALLREAVDSGAQVRAFGNGGSSAIVRSALLQLHTYAGLSVNDCMMTPAAMAYGAQQQTFRTVFAQSLAPDINEVGLVVVASVSGRSANILETVRLCADNSVPVLALVGGDGTQMEVADGMVWATGTTDQQISEDAMLTALTLAADVFGTRDQSPPAIQERHLHALATMGSAWLGNFLTEATAAVSGAIRTRRRIFVLCPDGGPLALAGEHFAHNLRWDAPLGVADVQPPFVISDPSLADMSAVYNDHPDAAHGVRYQLSSASPGDVVFLLAYDSDSRTVQEAIRAAEAAGAWLFLIHQAGLTGSGAEPRHFTLPQVNHFGQAALLQSIAHLVCRTTRAELTAGPAGQVTQLSSDGLMDQDLAPLRELSSAPEHL